MQENRLRYLYQRFNERTATDAEVEEFSAALSDPAVEHVVKSIIDNTWDTMSPMYTFPVASDRSQEIYDQITKEQVPVFNKRRTWARIAVAAAAATIIFGAGLFYFNAADKAIESKQVKYTTDIKPGIIGATLTLANGKKISLGDAAKGEITKEAGIRVTKTTDGELVYEILSQTPSGHPNPSLPGNKGDQSTLTTYNTLTTAKGETYILTLPDHSKVWMNAASSLTYAASLNEHGMRRVKLSGEAYFQVAKDKAHPFIVESKNQQVEVLGTHFNISAYNDEPAVKTTLVEGSVKITVNSINKVLKPNQQALVVGAEAIEVSDIEAEYAVAWKNGFFLFNSERLENIMIKISRWYNVEIEYTDPALKSETFIGTISRFEKVSKVLNMLERTDVASFKIVGNKIIINKKK
jgi:transmembrane sensor